MAAEELKSKVQADDGALNVETAPKTGNKVALDIDDAPFLQKDEPEPEAAPTADGTDITGALDASPDDSKKKKKLIISSLLFLLLAGGGGGWWFFFRTPPPPPVKPEVVQVPTAEQGANPAEFVVTFLPYWIELPDGKGGVVFLVAKFSAITRNERLALETQNKMPTLRDAVYYYLKNKSYEFLINPENTNTIKADLISVLSGYLGGGKIDDLLFESYLGR